MNNRSEQVHLSRFNGQ